MGRGIEGEDSLRRWCALALLAVAALGGCSKQETDWPRRFSVVTPGVLLRSALPTVAHLRTLKKHHDVKTVVALLNWRDLKRHPEVAAAREFAEKNGIHHVHLALGFPTDDQIRQFLEIVANPANRPVLVHCEQGEVRTGLMVAMHRMEHEGWPNERAYSEMLANNFDPTDRHQRIVRFIQDYKPRADHRGNAVPTPYVGGGVWE